LGKGLLIIVDAANIAGDNQNMLKNMYMYPIKVMT